ncbi:phage tail protein [Staphylococcus aureus]
MIKVINYEGEAFTLPVKTILTEKLNNDSELKFEFYETEETKLVSQTIAKKWLITNVVNADDIRKFVVTIVRRDSTGKSVKVSVIAKEKQIDDLKSEMVFDDITGSYTPFEYFKTIEKNSKYHFIIESKADSVRWEHAGNGDSAFSTLKKGLERYGMEFYFNPNNQAFYINKRVEDVANYYIHNGMNALNFKLEEDANQFFTRIHGYEDFPENSAIRDAKLKLEYTHPLAENVGYFEAPAIKDGRVKDENVLLEKMKHVVDNSLKQSLTLDFLYLKNEYFNHAVAHVGDVVPVKDNALNILDNIRIVEVKTVRDEQNVIVKQEVTLGDYKKRDRYRSQINNSISNIEKVEKLATQQHVSNGDIGLLKLLLNQFSDVKQSLQFDSDGIQSVSGLNKVIFSKNGIAISRDGGNNKINALTSEGINPDLIVKATHDQDGLMSKYDKKKLDLIFNKENTYLQIENLNVNLNQNDVIHLTKPISDLKNGLILVWKHLTTDTLNQQFISKKLFANREVIKCIHSVPIGQNQHLNKIAIVSNQSIVGIDENDSEEFNTDKVILQDIYEY